MPITFKQVSERMLDLGYEPIPSTRQKIPALEGWRDVKVNSSQVQSWNMNGMGEMNASTRLGKEVRPGIRLATVDVDVLDVEGAKFMWQTLEELTLGQFPGFRCGNAPKFAMPVLVREVDKKQRSKSYLDPKGNRSAIEVLNEGQQVVMFGELESGDTVKEYMWHRADPMNFPVENLPILDKHQIAKLFDAFEHFAESKGWKSADKKAEQTPVPKSTGSAAPREVVTALDNMRQPTASLMELELELRRIPPDVGNEDWFRVLAAIHFETGGSADGLQLADRWSRGDFSGVMPPNYRGFRDVEIRYESFRDHSTGPKTTVGTIKILAQQHAPDEPPQSIPVVVGEKIEESKPYAPTEDITETLPPVMQGIVDYYRAGCAGVYAPHSAAMTAIQTVAFCLQRSFVLQRNAGMWARPNIYHLQVLPTGVGKAAMNSTINDLINYVMPEEKCRGIIHSVASGAGLEDALLTTPNMLLLQDEIADKLVSGGASTDNVNLRNELRRLYSLSSESLKQRVKAITSHNKPLGTVMRPHLSVIGSTTPEKLASVTSVMDRHDGFLNRFIAVSTQKAELVMLPYSSREQQRLIPGDWQLWYDTLQFRMDMSERTRFGATSEAPEILRLPPDVEEWMYHDYQESFHKSEKASDPLVMRRFENAMKVSLVLQLAEDPESTRVSTENWEWALRYVDNGIRNLFDVSVRGVMDPDYIIQDSEVMRTLRDLFSESGVVVKLFEVPLTQEIIKCGLLTQTWLRRVLSRSSRLDRELTACLEIMSKTGEIGYFTGKQLQLTFKLPISNRNTKERYFFLLKDKDEVIRELRRLGETIVH